MARRIIRPPRRQAPIYSRPPLQATPRVTLKGKDDHSRDLGSVVDIAAGDRTPIRATPPLQAVLNPPFIKPTKRTRRPSRQAVGNAVGNVVSRRRRLLLEDTETIYEWPSVTAFTQQDIAEWNQIQSSGCRFNDDGTVMYRAKRNAVTGGVYIGSTYATPYVVTDSATPTQILTTPSNIADIGFNGDGTKVYTCRGDTALIEERTNSGTAFNPVLGDIDTVDNTYATTGTPSSVEFNGDGTLMYYTRRHAAASLYQVVLDTPYDLSSASSETTVDFTELGVNPAYCLRISRTGLKVYISTTTTVFEFDCSVAWDIVDTATDSGNTLVVSTEIDTTTVWGFDVSPDGTTLIAGGQFGSVAGQNETNRFTSAGA